MSRILSARLKRLEKRHRPRRQRQFVIFAIQPEEAPSPIMGIASLSAECARLFGEDALSAFAVRARAVLGGVRFATAVYAAPMPAGAPTAAPAASTEPTAPADPFALAGIGRVDDRYLGWHESNA